MHLQLQMNYRLPEFEQFYPVGRLQDSDRDEADEPPVHSADQADPPSSSQSCAAGPLLHEGT